MSNFLVTDLKVIDSPQAGLGVARCLKGAGHTVYGADDTPFVTSSDLFKKTVVLEEIRTLNLDSLLKKLITYRDVYKIEHIVPCYDETAILFSFVRDKIDFLGLNLIAPDIESLKKVRKNNLPNVATKTLLSPETLRVKSLDQAKEAAKRIGYPVFVKGLTKAAIRAKDEEELASAVTKVCGIWNNGEIDCLIQQSVTGKLINSLVAYKAGKIVAYLEMEKIGSDPNGATWFGKLTAGRGLFEATTEILQKIGLNDCIVEIETIKDKDGKHYMYEINPRPPAWIYASCLNGMNFLELFLSPKEETIFNAKEVFFGRETTDFIKELPASADLSNLSVYSKGAAYKTSHQHYPSELMLMS